MPGLQGILYKADIPQKTAVIGIMIFKIIIQLGIVCEFKKGNINKIEPIMMAPKAMNDENKWGFNLLSSKKPSNVLPTLPPINKRTIPIESTK